MNNIKRYIKHTELQIEIKQNIIHRPQKLTEKEMKICDVLSSTLLDKLLEVLSRIIAYYSLVTCEWCGKVIDTISIADMLCDDCNLLYIASKSQSIVMDMCMIAIIDADNTFVYKINDDKYYLYNDYELDDIDYACDLCSMIKICENVVHFNETILRLYRICDRCRQFGKYGYSTKFVAYAKQFDKDVLNDRMIDIL